MSNNGQHPADHWRLQLNNLLQRTYGTQALYWDRHQHGPQHSGTWEAIAYINNVEYGRGTGPTLGDAKEMAARQAYAALYNQVYGA